MNRQHGKKKEGVATDPWEDIVWMDDAPVYRPTKKKERGRGVLTNKRKMIKFLSVNGQ